MDLYRGRLDQYGQRNRLSDGLAAGPHVCRQAWAAPPLCRRHDCDDTRAAGIALTRDFWFLSLWRVLAGLGGAPAFIAGGAMVSTLFRGDPSRNAMAIAVYGGGGGFGTLLTALLIPSMLANGGNDAWPIAWLLLAALSALATIPAVFAAHVIPLSIESRGGETPGAVSIGPMLPALIGYFLFSIGYIVYITFLISWMRSQGAGRPATWAVLGLAIMLSPVPWRPPFGAGPRWPSACAGRPCHLCWDAASIGGSWTHRPLAFGGHFRRLLFHRPDSDNRVRAEFAGGELGPLGRALHMCFRRRPNAGPRRGRRPRRRNRIPGPRSRRRRRHSVSRSRHRRRQAGGTEELAEGHAPVSV